MQTLTQMKENLMRRKLIVGNWKMNKSLREGRDDFLMLRDLCEKSNVTKNIDVGIAAPDLMLAELASRMGHLSLYAQNCHWAKAGAFTGETPAGHLMELGLRGSLVAHSERRSMNGESNRTAGLRMQALVGLGLECVLCVGETLEEREKGLLETVLTEQWTKALEVSDHPLRAETVLGSDPLRPLLSIAYEPVWAIGTGKAATALEAQAAHAFVRSLIAKTWGQNVADKMRILYGGSVTLANAKSFFGAPDIDGALVGGASLKPSDFSELCLAGV
jgi:triosephosphate isomerase (TIM)